MSGGHFDYKNYNISDIVDTLKNDRERFESGDIEVEKKASIITFIDMIINNLSKYESLLHEYDYFMASDNCEAIFWANVARILNWRL